MKILISAAEASSDAHGAELLRALKSLTPGKPMDAFGVGGPKLQAEGLRTVIDARELLVMGFGEVLTHLPKIFRSIRKLDQAAGAEKPDLAIVIDYPDFHFRLARRLKKRGIPVFYYIPPKIWVWRKHRIRFLKEFFAGILSILPFEEEFYRKQNVPVKYVGNPLADELPLDLTRAMARRRLFLDETDKVVVLMPGSRPSELKHHVSLMLDSALRAARQLTSRGWLKDEEKLVVLMPLPLTAEPDEIKTQIDRWVANCKGRVRIEIRTSQGNSSECLVAADAGLIKSGTSTLEAGLLRCPHVVVYKPNRLTAWIFKYLIRYKGPVGLVNLVTGWTPGEPYLAKEILCEDVTEVNLASELVSLLTDPARREALFAGFDRLRQSVIGSVGGKSPSVTAAQEVLNYGMGRELR